MSPTTTTPPVVTAAFTIDRTIAASPERVFRAFADVEAKRRWFGGPDAKWTPEVREMDFRVGGQERVRGQWHDGPLTDFRATYHDIVPGQRIVYVYDMYVNERKLSVSLASILLSPEGSGTRLVLTEQGVFLDGYDDAGSRERGTKSLMEALAKSVEG